MRLGFVAVVALALGLRSIEVFRRSLQVDEGLTLWLGGLPIAQSLDWLRLHDVHPPGLTLLIHGLLALHTPDWLVRVLALLIGTASVVLVMLVVRAWSTPAAALIAGFFAACMPLLIFNDSMIRMYTPFDALALASLYVLSMLLVRDGWSVHARRALWVVWTICSIGMLYLLYSALFVFVAELTYVAICRRDALLKMAAGLIVTLAAFGPQLTTFMAQVREGGMAFPSFEHQQAQLIATLPEQATLQIPYDHVLGMALVVIVWLWVIAAFGVTSRSAPRSPLPWLAVPAILTLGYSLAAHKLLYVDRYYTIFAYGLCCWTGVALSAATHAADRASLGPTHSLGPRVARSATFALSHMVAAVGACVLILAVAVQHVTDPRHTTADWRAVGALLRSSAQPGDLFVFEQGSPVWVLGRMGVLDHHPIYLVFTRRQAMAAPRVIAPFKRVWYVRFQSQPVDPSDLVLRFFNARERLVRYWRFDRALASEAVLVAEFQVAR